MDVNPFNAGSLPYELSNTAGYAAGRFSLAKTAQLILAQLAFAIDPRHKRKILTLTAVTSAAIHAAKESLFAATELTGVVNDSGGTVLLKTVTVIDKGNTAPIIDLAFFRASVTWGTANAAIGLSDADALQLLGVVSIATADYIDTNANSIATKRDINLILKPTTGTSIWVAGGTGAGTPTPGSTDAFTFRFGIET